MPMTKAGLEDVVAANSAICDIIGPEGKLTYRGIDIHDLARQSSFEETTYLLWFGGLPPAKSCTSSPPARAGEARPRGQPCGKFPAHALRSGAGSAGRAGDGSRADPARGPRAER